MGILKNLARMTVASSGTGTITLSAAVSGFLTFDLAGCSTAAAGSLITYAILDIGQSEIGRGTYFSSSRTLTRSPSVISTNLNTNINMTNAAQVLITPAAEDYQKRFTVTSYTSAQSGTYTAPVNTLWLEIQAVGAGGGGGAAAGTFGSSGATTTFGPISATGGGGGLGGTGGGGGPGSSASGGNIGNFTGSAGAPGLALSGGEAVAGNSAGGFGGNSFFGGGAPGTAVSPPTAGVNGGGGAGSAVAFSAGAATYSGGGGGGGGMAWHLVGVNSSGASYSFTVGAGGLGSSSTGTGVLSSGATGGDGMIVIKEYYVG